jgi:hypothetical protein
MLAQFGKGDLCSGAQGIERFVTLDHLVRESRYARASAWW